MADDYHTVWQRAFEQHFRELRAMGAGEDEAIDLAERMAEDTALIWAGRRRAPPSST